MKIRGLVIVFIFAVASFHSACADIFEHVNPEDTVLRSALNADRSEYYFHSAGIDYEEVENSITLTDSASKRALSRANGLYNSDETLNKYLKNDLSSSSYIPTPDSNNPLLLLTYSSPAAADVVKHSRIAALERVSLEEARLREVEGASEGIVDKLAKLSEKNCLEANESQGLMNAMRTCRSEEGMFTWLKIDIGSGNGDPILGSGVLNVVSFGLKRLGFSDNRIESIRGFSGDVTITKNTIKNVTIYKKGVWSSNKTFKNFYVWFKDICKGYKDKWDAALTAYQDSASVSDDDLKGLSFPGVPVTPQTFSGLSLLPKPARDVALIQLSSSAALVMAERLYREVASYLELAAQDPELPLEYRELILARKQYCLSEFDKLRADRESVLPYKDLLAQLSQDSDVSRARLSIEGNALPAGDAAQDLKDLLLMPEK
ncbi:MAG: hypothetical protein HQL16_04885 [Candidatus Omnitrophica bacterium]|nr:hypothetical protein [Candidatus Omnitrophota bacterium]